MKNNKKIVPSTTLEKFFDETTMSIHLRENVVPHAKKGMPGKWDFVSLSDKRLSQEDIKKISDEIIEEVRNRDDGFVEVEREGSSIIQLGVYRITITRPPFSDGWEITAVRPTKSLRLSEYELSDKLKQRIEKAEGILISGAPGHGKTTFAQALAMFYSSKDKIVKTIEAPRDLQVGDEITQYAISHGSAEEIHDILLLSRPDYTVFDEMRNTNDFALFSDLRLSGIGLVGVIHATQPIDAIHRFIGRIELGVIPHVIDTVIFIKDGCVGKVFSLKMLVKVPCGMTEADLARPVVVVEDFETGKLDFEIYSYGEETVVIPATSRTKSPALELAKKEIAREFSKYSKDIKVEMLSENKARVYLPEKKIGEVIGKEGKKISAIEKTLGLGIDVEALGEGKRKEIDFESRISKKFIEFQLGGFLANKDIDVYIGNKLLMTAKADSNGVILIKKKKKIGKELVSGINQTKIKLFCLE